MFSPKKGAEISGWDDHPYGSMSTVPDAVT